MSIFWWALVYFNKAFLVFILGKLSFTWFVLGS